MEIVVVLFVLWVFVTLVGHGSWLLIRAIFGAITDQPVSRPVSANPEREDLVAGHRLVRRLMNAGLIDHEQAVDLHRHLRELEFSHTPSSLQDSPDSRNTSADQPEPWLESPLPGPQAEPITGQSASAGQESDEEPILAKLCDDSHTTTPAMDAQVFPERGVPDTQSAPPASTPSQPMAPSQPMVPAQPVAPAQPRLPTQPSAPVLTKAEIIQSFLAAHNIRWGELVAGMLIVICSIGLVISLWRTIVETHRVIPSLIFLGANAAIYAAGLYTLSRWKLRHTSRAVLVIATLLVPLSVLAGLAAAGTGTDAVRLNDPITLLSLTIAAAIYSVLLLLGGRALTGPYARQVAISVAGPATVLPLIPAAIRNFGSDAGWCIAIGSAAIVVSLTWMIKIRHRETRLGVVGSRARLLVMAFGGFALAVAIGYSLFAVSGFQPLHLAVLPIAISAIPALVGLAAAGRSLMTSARSATQSMIGAVTCVLLVGLSWAILPASMVEARWLWSWAVTLSATGMVIGWILKQPRWLPLSTLPIGIATIVSSHVWMTGAAWDSIPIWNRIIGGQPMLAATLVAALICLATAAIRDRERRAWMGYAAMFWIGCAILSAGALAVGPESLLGIAPWWSVTAILASCVIASVFFASRQQAWSLSTIAATTLACCSYFRPLQLFHSDPVQTPDVWMYTALSVAATLMLLREIAPWIKPLRNRVTMASAATWENASVAASVLAALIACLSATGDWSTSATVLAIATALVTWAATASRSLMTLRVAQLGSITAAIVLGYGQYFDRLFAVAAWHSGQAPWAWAIMAATITGFWFIVRELARVDAPIIRRRLGFIKQTQARASEMVDGWTAHVSATLVALGAVWVFAALLTDVANSDLISSDAGFLLPVIAIVAGSGIALWMRRQQSGWRDDVLTDTPLVTFILSTIVWASSFAAGLWEADAMGRLVAATTAAAVGCLGLRAISEKLDPRLNSKISSALSVSVSGLMLLASSIVLLIFGWFDPIIQGELALAVPTISVASWWLIGAAAMLYGAKRSGNRNLAVGSAWLTPAAVALVVPVVSVVHPIVWLQCAAIASLAWVVVTRQWFRGDDAPVALPALLQSSLWAMSLGVVTAALVTLRLLLDVDPLDVVCGPAGAILSLLTVVTWTFGRLPLASRSDGGIAAPASSLIWPIGLTLLAGQAAWLLDLSGLIADVYVPEAERYFSRLVNLDASETLLTIWCVAAVASLVRYRFLANKFDFWHAALISTALMLFGIVMGQFGSTWMPWVGLVATIGSGLLAACVAIDQTASNPRWIAGRLLGWSTIGLGLLVIDQLGSGHPWPVKWTVLVTWVAGWIVAWRLLSPDRKEKWAAAAKAIPDVEFSWLLMLAAVGELLFIIASEGARAAGMIDWLLALRVAAYVAAALSTCLRSGRKLVWPQAIGTLVAVASLCSVRVGFEFEATIAQQAMLASLTAGFFVAVLAHSLPWVAKTINLTHLWRADAVPVTVGRLVRALLQVAAVVSAAAVVLAAAMIGLPVKPSVIQLTILSVALVAWAIAELAELSRNGQLRHAAVSLALMTIALFASVDAGETLHPFLSASMRWLVASVFTTAMILFAVPRLMGQTILSRWQAALRRGAVISSAAAGGSLVVMLAIEAVVRTPEGIAGVSRPMAIGVAITLAILSIIAGLLAILSGSKKMSGKIFELTDVQRRGLILTAQAIGAITWLHLFLCKTNWAFVGLRSYWPYIVMAIAFLSVGVTEWARRRGDKVLSETLAHTSLYLPLVPVLGFWLSGAWSELSWVYVGGKVRYDLLLALGAVYYVALSAMWKQALPRIAAIVLGNAALWVVLIQLPGWSFITHPQAWLIPPAVCVLAATHLYRERLQPAAVSAIRYASTLVIYVSSTADMLLQQIGQNISGPIILVLLALAGMLVGVLLQVRPFLYLGATFVFIGVTSMVWHAQVSIDAVWPWWVFGITTGILLLAGLMALEKNKDKLRQYANTLASWQG